MDCIFCSIVGKKIPADIVYESDHVLAFRDIHPKAPTHVLVVPKIHIEHLAELEKQPEVSKRYWEGVINTARELGVLDWAKIQINSGKQAGQEVLHLHAHILSDKGRASI